jgi:hypothetical protein
MWSDITPLTKFGYGLEEEAIRVIKKSDKWVPGIRMESPSVLIITQIITFIVEPGG